MSTTAESTVPFLAAPDNTLLTLADLASGLGVAERTIRRWVKQQTIPPPLRITPKYPRWLMRDIRAWLERCAKEAQEEARRVATEARAIEEKNRRAGLL